MEIEDRGSSSLASTGSYQYHRVWYDPLGHDRFMTDASDGLTGLLAAIPDFFQLQLLGNKEKQLQQAGTLGQHMLAPEQIELQEKITLIQELDAAQRWTVNDLDTDARERYREHIENAQLSSAFGTELLISLPINDLQREEPERSKTPASSAAQSRHAKNAAHRAGDIVASVRRLQSLLGERGKESSEGESGQVQQLEVAPSSPSPLASPSNHASINGMDSVYTNALRRSASYCLLLSNSGPFRQSVLIHSSHGGTPPRHSRGGAKKYARRRLSESPLSLSMEHAMVGVHLAPHLKRFSNIVNRSNASKNTHNLPLQSSRLQGTSWQRQAQREAEWCVPDSTFSSQCTLDDAEQRQRCPPL
ncbi:hypothetical protein SCLCIDRAFT_31589 [Scleroderma citrinum Foug A]|uniref:Uncharacterized protein n=1 Tax=Scleroderma citrinum Foug A TaxID=1036808 RepID=A0A0C3DBJ7_9AGAM|nr:hypothetical protein SCLCIDRAFT_31589 [Scleroderma citrinum Foug A]